MSTRAKKEKKKPHSTTTQNQVCSPNTSMASQHEDATSMASQQDDTTSIILQELRDFRRDNKSQLDDIKEEITRTNTRLDEAEERIVRAEDRLQNVEDIMQEMIRLQAQMEAKITDQESRARRENIRIYGINEEAENEFPNMIAFVEKLLGDNLDISDPTSLQIERAHRSLGTKPTSDEPPRSILVRFASFKVKDTILRNIWKKKGLVWRGAKVNVDNDYPPRIIQKRKEYGEARRILKDRGIKFKTGYPAKLRVDYKDGPKTYETVEEATRDMHERGFPIEIIKPPATLMGRLQQLTWQRKTRRTTRRSPTYKAKLQAFRRESSPVTDSGVTDD